MEKYSMDGWRIACGESPCVLSSLQLKRIHLWQDNHLKFEFPLWGFKCRLSVFQLSARLQGVVRTRGTLWFVAVFTSIVDVLKERSVPQWRNGQGHRCHFKDDNGDLRRQSVYFFPSEICTSSFVTKEQEHDRNRSRIEINCLASATYHWADAEFGNVMFLLTHLLGCHNMHACVVLTNISLVLVSCKTEQLILLFLISLDFCIVGML